MLDFYRVAAAVPELRVADVRFNADKICEKLDEAHENGAQIVVFPELCITGYTCADLFFQSKLLNEIVPAIERIAKRCKAHSLTAAVGAPLSIGGQLYNCAVVICCGSIVGIAVKTFLPNYNEFYERRWFSSSNDLDKREIRLSDLGFCEDRSVPVGRDLVFKLGDLTFGIELCEDLWTPLAPSAFQALSGAQLILNLSASNETISKRAYRRELVRQQSARTVCAYVYASAGASESTGDLIFSGHSLVAENGAVLAENKELIDSDYLLCADIDIGRIMSDRMKLKSFKDCACTYGAYQPCRTVAVGGVDIDGCDGSLYPVRRRPFVPATEKHRRQRCLNIFEMQVAGLCKRLDVTGCRPVVGVSGGLDSTLALLVCVRAMQRLGRDVGDVVGITMPCFGTTGRTYRNSISLMDKLGVTVREINIKNACMQHFSDIGHDPTVTDLTYENTQARERTQVLMDYAGSCGGLVVGTGDLSELALGWCTYNGDHMSMYAVNMSIPKTLISWMIDSLAEYGVFEGASDILRDILDTPISPELLPPDKAGEIAQRTEDVVGPYILHDFFLYYVMRYGFSPEKIYHLAKSAFDGDFDDDTIKKWLKSFYRRFFSQQFKRSCMPDGVKVGSVCLSPRGDWRMPSDASAKLWLEAAENL